MGELKISTKPTAVSCALDANTHLCKTEESTMNL